MTGIYCACDVGPASWPPQLSAMVLATHKNFQSLVPAVADAETMFDKVGLALCHQYLFDRETPPREKNLWAPWELLSFEINLSCVDRLYHIRRNEHDDTFELVARVEHKNRHLFVELSCSCYFECLTLQGGGQIYVSYDAGLFAKVITTKMENERLFYTSLGVEGRSMQERWPVRRWRSPPSLGLLCHLAVSTNISRLSHYSNLLPLPLTRNLDEFLKAQEAMKMYDGFS